MKGHRPAGPIRLKVFDEEIEVFFDRERFIERLRFYDAEPALIIAEDRAAGYCTAIEGIPCLHFIYISDACKHRTISHEAVHAAYAVCRSCGIPDAGENEELIAYLAGHIASEIYAMADRKIERSKR